LAVFDGLAVGDEDFDDGAGGVGVDFVEDFHGFDDADDGFVFGNLCADGGEGVGFGVGGAVEGADHGGFDGDEAFVGVGGGRGGSGGVGRGMRLRGEVLGGGLVVGGDAGAGDGAAAEDDAALVFDEFDFGEAVLRHQGDQILDALGVGEAGGGVAGRCGFFSHSECFSETKRVRVEGSRLPVRTRRTPDLWARN
jgi:hypothetical protein